MGARECSWWPIPTARRRCRWVVPASHDDLDREPTPDPAVRAASRIFPTDAGEEVLGRFDSDCLWCRRLERRTGGGKPGTLVAAGEQPVVAQALEAGRQHVAQEASDEGAGRQAHRTFAAGFVVAHPKAHLPRIAAEQAVIRERHAVRVAGKVIEHLGGSAWRRLGVDHPVVRQQRAASGLPCTRRSVRIVGQLAAAVSRVESRQELAAKHLRGGLDGKQEARAAHRCAPSALGVEPTTGDQGVHMQVHAQVLAPSVEHEAEAGHGAQPARVGGELEQGGRRTVEQRAVEPARVPDRQRIEHVGQREHPVRVGHRQHLAQARRTPG